MKPVQNQRGTDSFEDIRQVGLRLEVLRVLAVVICLLLGIRLSWLQVVNRENYSVLAEQNRVRILAIPAPRGTIYDRKGRALVTSRNSYNIVLSREKGQRLEDKINLIVENLRVDREWLTKRFEAAKYEPKYEYIVVKETATAEDVAWVEAHKPEYPELLALEAPQRVYIYGKFAAHALGYVGEVSKKELRDPNSLFSEARGFKLGDIIGKSGFERYYNDLLMGKDGERRVVVDSRGQIKSELSRVEPIPGRDIYTTLDYDIQFPAEEQGDTMPTGRGALVVMDPNNGEVFAMVSRPAFDPNVFSQRSKTPEGRDEISELYSDEDKPLYNRVIQAAMAPGSTWKLFTTVAALNEGVITPEDSKIQDGSIQLGSYFMSSMSHLGYPDVVTAIARSADGYYYRLGLKMGGERFEKWVHIFRFGERTGVDLPNERAGRPPTPSEKKQFYEAVARNLKKKRAEAGEKWTERDEKQYEFLSRWTDYDMAASAFGQGRNETTPIQLLRYVGALATGGQMVTPHLLHKVPAVERDGVRAPELRYQDRNTFTVPMSPAIHEIVKKGMWNAVNGDGTAGAARVEGFDVCGKTGTAQVASKARAGEKNKDNAWFISFAPRDKPEICAVILTENAGFGGRNSAPRAKVIYEGYYKRTRGLPVEVAKNSEK
jgi:penicillin-binding protein 2